MTSHPLPDREVVIAMLAEYGSRAPEQVDDAVGSLELAWLITKLELRYQVLLDLTDEELDRIRTVADATEILGRAIAASGRTSGPGGSGSAAAGAALT